MVFVEVNGDLELEQETEEFTENLVDEIGLDTRKIAIWDSSRTFYQGRDHSDIPVIGLESGSAEENKHSIAHELGHDFHDMKIGELLRSEPLVMDDKLIHSGSPEDSIDVIMKEMVAEMVAEKYADLSDPLGRDPFQDSWDMADDYRQIKDVKSLYKEVKQGLDENDFTTENFNDNIKIWRAHMRSISKSDRLDTWYSYDAESPKIEFDRNDHYLTLNQIAVRSNFVNTMRNVYTGKADTGEIILNSWIEEEKDIGLDRMKFFSPPLRDKLVENLGRGFQAAYRENQENIRAMIEKNTFDMTESVIDYSLSKIGDLLDEFHEDSRISQIASPAHITPLIEDGEISEYINTSYSHGVGCSTGIVLARNGIEPSDLVSEWSDFEDLGSYALHEAVRLGYQDEMSDGSIDQDYFRDTVEYFLEERDLI